MYFFFLIRRELRKTLKYCLVSVTGDNWILSQAESFLREIDKGKK